MGAQRNLSSSVQAQYLTSISCTQEDKFKNRFHFAVCLMSLAAKCGENNKVHHNTSCFISTTFWCFLWVRKRTGAQQKGIYLFGVNDKKIKGIINSLIMQSMCLSSKNPWLLPNVPANNVSLRYHTLYQSLTNHLIIVSTTYV
jgi:hypothetical protein